MYIDCFKCVAVAVLCKFSGYLIAESQKTKEMVVEGKNRVALKKYSFTTTLFAPIIWYIEGRMHSYYLFKVNKAFFYQSFCSFFCFMLLLHYLIQSFYDYSLLCSTKFLFMKLVKFFWKGPLST